MSVDICVPYGCYQGSQAEEKRQGLLVGCGVFSGDRTDNYILPGDEHILRQLPTSKEVGLSPRAKP